MRSSLRFIIPLTLALLVIAYASVLVFDQLTLAWFTRDVDARSHLASSAIQDALLPPLKSGNIEQIKPLLSQVTNDERLYALAVCGPSANELASTDLFVAVIDCPKGISLSGEKDRLLQTQSGIFHLTAVPIKDGESAIATLLFVHDMGFAKRRSATTTRYIYYVFLVLGIIVACLTLLILRLTWKGWVSGVQSVIRGKGEISTLPGQTSEEWLPIVKELRSLVSEMESEKKLHDGARVVWDPKTLKEMLSSRLSGDEIIIVSNREPYIHNKVSNGIEVQLPASGLVTALEPVMRACSGIWVAHGGGSADREVVDESDKIWVPPGEKAYQLRRVWLSKEEEQGYYYGFANEGIWPLCHIAHTRPVFRSKDWEFYKQINERFADAVVEEATSDSPVVLVQDYHFAILPAMIRKRLPKATVITFWHIPWPNAEAFGICPWRNEILRGLLGSTILGFHTRYHRNNFLDTVDRFIECRIDREWFTVSHQEQLTAVRNYPISIEWPPKWLDQNKGASDCRSAVQKRHSLPASAKIALGVERLDYTKGVIERFAAVERLFELYPEWIGNFTLLQIAAPSRVEIGTYARFAELVKQEAERINALYPAAAIPPIILLNQHHDHHMVYEYLRAADVCLVTSLHDGMNLVAKEFIAARTDEEGVLILSMFAGASRELPEALIVNPYSADQCAEALHLALRMPEEEQRSRMRSMREQVREFNVYRWAGRMLVDAAQVRDKMRLSEQLSETRQSGSDFS